MLGGRPEESVGVAGSRERSVGIGIEQSYKAGVTILCPVVVGHAKVGYYVILSTRLAPPPKYSISIVTANQA